MASSVPTQEKNEAHKPAPAARKKQPAPREEGPRQPLQFRYHGPMKPGRVYPLVVAVPRRTRDEAGEVVVVRPLIPGALVTPPEQRLNLGEAGNQVVFHVAPLARGNLRRARVEVHGAGRPAQVVPLPLKVKTQRAALLLLLLTFLAAWLVWRWTRDDWNAYLSKSDAHARREPGGWRNPQEEEAFFPARGTDFAAEVVESWERDWLKVPFFNAPFDPNGEGWQTFTLAREARSPMAVGYAGLLKGVVKHRWLLFGVIALLGLTFVVWMFHHPRPRKRRGMITLASPAEEGEPATLRPL